MNPNRLRPPDDGGGGGGGWSWKPKKRGGGRYFFRTLYLGDDLSLDIINDGINTTPCVAQTGNYSGQYWSVTEWDDATCKLVNDFTGPAKSLGTCRDTNAPFMDTGDHMGQHWTLTKIAAKSDPAPNADPDRLRAIVQTEASAWTTRFLHWIPNLLAADQVTVRMLVANTAGDIDYVTVEDFLNLQLSEPFRTFTDDELINYAVRDGKMNFAPGTSQHYSHTDNVILGQVIQRATGQSMKELYDRNIFGPMGMRDTQFPVNQEIQSPVLHAFTKDRKVLSKLQLCPKIGFFWHNR